MIYFIAWVVFILVLILAVPIASMIEKRGRAAAADPVEPLGYGDDEVEEAPVDVAEFDAVDNEGEDFSAEESVVVESDDDAFAEFDKEFK